MKAYQVPVINWSKLCPKCGGRLLRLVVGNIVDYRHDYFAAGGAAACRAL